MSDIKMFAVLNDSQKR